MRAETGFERPVQFGPLATMTVGHGIDDRWWGPVPVEVAPDEEPDQAQAEETLATAALTAADIDTDDLAAIVTGPDASSAAPSGVVRTQPKRQRQNKLGRGPTTKPKRDSNAG